MLLKDPIVISFPFSDVIEVLLSFLACFRDQISKLY